MPKRLSSPKEEHTQSVKENKMIPVVSLYPHEKNMDKLASEAGLWYNKRVNIVVSEGTRYTTQTLINLFRRFIMDTLPSYKQEDNTFIYALVDPNTYQVRYVGKSNRPANRLWAHLKSTDKEKTHKANWLRSLQINNQVPQLIILEEVPKPDWQERERFWIAFYRDQGANLTNIAPGGYGCDHDAETIERIASKNRGRKLTEEHKQKIGKGCKGHYVSEATRQRWIKLNKNKSEETKKRIGESQVGRKLTEEHKQKTSASMKGRGHPHTEETKQVLKAKSIANGSGFKKGHTHSSETKIRISTAQKGKARPPRTKEHQEKLSKSRIENNAKRLGVSVVEYMEMRGRRKPRRKSG